MLPVDPKDRVTLLLDKSWQPTWPLTARASFYHFCRNRVIGLDLHKSQFTFEQWMLGCADESTLSEQELQTRVKVELDTNHPCMRSAHHEWPLPTVTVMRENFTINSLRKIRRKPGKSRPAKRMSRIDLCRVNKFKCQLCHEKFDYEELTVEHIIPRARGGTDTNDNITLTCGPCNSMKADRTDVVDIYGNPLQPSAEPPDHGQPHIADEILRADWLGHLYTH